MVLPWCWKLLLAGWGYVLSGLGRKSFRHAEFLDVLNRFGQLKSKPLYDWRELLRQGWITSLTRLFHRTTEGLLKALDDLRMQRTAIIFSGGLQFGS